MPAVRLQFCLMKNKLISKTVIGIDLGDKKHAICVVDQEGNIVAEFSIENRRRELAELSKNYPGSLVAMEVGTHSPWISRLLTGLGMNVVVANARKLRVIYTNERKCDEYDAQMLAKLARVDIELLHPITHRSKDSQQDLLMIKLRDTLVRQRVTAISSIRSSLKALGFQLPAPSSPSFAGIARAELEQNPELLLLVEPALCAIDELSKRILEFDRMIRGAIKTKHPQAQRLQQITGVGPITSLCFVLTVEDEQRFSETRDVAAYFGLVPRRFQSGDSDKQLPISKTGNRYMRKMLVQSAQYIMGHFGPDCELRRYGLRLTERGGAAAKKKAVIAVARKLSVLLLTLWKNQSDYQPLRDSQTTTVIQAS